MCLHISNWCALCTALGGVNNSGVQQPAAAETSTQKLLMCVYGCLAYLSVRVRLCSLQLGPQYQSGTGALVQSVQTVLHVPSWTPSALSYCNTCITQIQMRCLRRGSGSAGCIPIHRRCALRDERDKTSDSVRKHAPVPRRRVPVCRLPGLPEQSSLRPFNLSGKWVCG